MNNLPNDENIQVVQRAYDALNRRDFLTELHDILAPDVMEETPGLNVSTGAENYVRAREVLINAFPDLTIESDVLAAQGDTVVTRETLRGTHEGRFLGIDPMGREIDTSGVTLWRIRDGRIVERRSHLNLIDLVERLGGRMTVEVPGDPGQGGTVSSGPPPSE